MKKLLCTLFAAAVVAAMSAVTAFAEDNLVFVKTVPTPNEFTEYAKNVFNENKDVLVGVGLTEEEAKSAVLGNSFVIKDVDDTNENNYQFPIFCNGKAKAVLTVSDLELENSKNKYFFGISQSDIMKNLNDLTTSPADPAEIYRSDKISDDFVFAVTNDEFTLLYAPNGYKKEEMEKAKAKIKNIRSGEDNLDKEYVINVYGYSKTGWITVDGSKYFIRKNGTLATGNLTIGSKRYKFDENGKYLGTFTGFVRSGGKRCYYKDGVKMTGDFTVNGKPYRTDKNGIIEDKKIYVKTQDIPEDIINYAKNVFKENESRLIGVGLTEAQAKSAVIRGGFVIKNADDPNETEYPYQFPILCNGRAVACLAVFPLENGEYTFSISKSNIMEKLNDLTTAPTAPAEIYFSDKFVFAVINDEFTLLDAPNGYKKDKMEKAIQKIKTYRSNVKFKNDIVTAI